MKKLILSAIAAICLSTAAACITVNIYFPAPEVRAAAEEIVEETWGDPATAPSSRLLPAAGAERLLAALAARLGPADAHAAEANIEVSTAAIRALKESMKQRAPKLKPQLASGKLGLGKDGMLVVRDLGDLGLREQAEVRRLVEAENRDRASLYAEIAKANDFGADRVADISAIFAETWKEKAESGWWVQNTDGTWSRR
jgi:uncharacterized protein YdbL (DUF1318 family)